MMKWTAKRIALRVAIIIILIAIALFLKGQEPEFNKPIFYDFGTWTLDVDHGTKIGIHAFITRDIRKEYPKNAYDQKSAEPYEVHRYELYLESKSTHANREVNTWIYGARVFIEVNGIRKEMTADQFPDGFILSVTTKPMMVYWYETVPVENLGIYINWENAVYESRNLQTY